MHVEHLDAARHATPDNVSDRIGKGFDRNNGALRLGILLGLGNVVRERRCIRNARTASLAHRQLCVNVDLSTLCENPGIGTGVWIECVTLLDCTDGNEVDLGREKAALSSHTLPSFGRWSQLRGW